jgi:hypothetical protein
MTIYQGDTNTVGARVAPTLEMSAGQYAYTSTAREQPNSSRLRKIKVMRKRLDMVWVGICD